MGLEPLPTSGGGGAGPDTLHGGLLGTFPPSSGLALYSPLALFVSVLGVPPPQPHLRSIGGGVAYADHLTPKRIPMHSWGPEPSPVIQGHKGGHPLFLPKNVVHGCPSPPPTVCLRTGIRLVLTGQWGGSLDIGRVPDMEGRYFR